MRGGVVVGIGILAACREPPPQCLEREYFRDAPDLYQVARLPDGYVLDAPGRLVGYDNDDLERFQLGISALEFQGTRDGTLVTLAIDGEALVLARWAADGAALGELARAVVGADVLNISQRVISDDGVALVSGYTDEAGYWWTRLEHGRDAVVHRSDTTARTGIAAVRGGDAYVLESTWQDELAISETATLTRLGPDGAPRWATRIFGDAPDTPSREVIVELSAAGDAAYVVTFEHAQSEFVIRRYDADGALVWRRAERRPIDRPPGQPVARDDGTLLWVDDLDASIRVRAIDNAGDVLGECTAPADGNRLSDVELDGDELFVVTIDRITRLRVGPPLGR